MSRHKTFKSAEEAVEYLFSEEIEADMVALPPDVDEITDEESFDDDETGCPVVQDIPGTVEINLPEDGDVPSYSTASSSSAKGTDVQSQPQNRSSKKKKCEPAAVWSKTNPNYNFGSVGSLAQSNRENIVNALQGCTPLEIFEEFLTSELLNNIVEETAKYAKQWKNKPQFSTSVDDLKVFIGFLIFSGYHTLPNQRDYWSEDDDLMVPLVKSAIPRNKYLELKAMLHFVDNNEANANKSDRGFKVRNLIVTMNKNFQKWGIFDENLSIDEMMIRYYGRHSLKQFLKGKPIRFGYKFWALCGSGGYCYNFDLYCGKDVSEDSQPLGTRVVKKMLECVADPNSHIIYFDNFFSSYYLFVELKQMGFRATGTIRQNRTAHCPFEADKVLAKKERGSYDSHFDTTNQITMVKWNDNTCVSLATNFDGIEPLVSVSRRQKGQKEKKLVKQPYFVSQYNKYMGGVDHHDWLLEKHTIAVRGKKWYWPIFIRIVDMAVVNTYVLFNTVSREAKSIKDIRRYIATSYLKIGQNARRSIGRPVPLQTSRKKVLDTVRLDGRGHIIGKREKQRRCQFPNCSGKPLTFCTKCDVTLCTPCFPQFHK